jgi:hypothetical protein
MTSTSSSSSCEFEKVCTGCLLSLPVSSFHHNAAMADGYLTRCKDCARCTRLAANARYDTEGADSENTAKRMRQSEPVATSDLYIMAFSIDPEGAVHGFKVGRSANIPQRAMGLTAGLPFIMLVLATFPGAGDLEETVHTQLAHCRNNSGRAREWFHTPLSNVMHAVACALQSRPKVNGGPAAAAATTEQ